jgi:hypothetical protein
MGATEQRPPDSSAATRRTRSASVCGQSRICWLRAASRWLAMTGSRPPIRPQCHRLELPCGAPQISGAAALVLHQRPKRISKAKGNKERRAKAARRSFAFYSPRPQLLKGFTKESLLSKTKPSDGDFRAATRGLWTDAFFGASPVVASALGIRSGATPRGRIHSKPSPSALPRKEDISTLLGIGHFYFALTG